MELCNGVCQVISKAVTLSTSPKFVLSEAEGLGINSVEGLNPRLDLSTQPMEFIFRTLKSKINHIL